jgi:hypothetical protein
MTGYKSKRAIARDKLLQLAQEGMNMHSHDAPEFIVCEALIEALAQEDKPAQKSCACANCGKKDEDGWALYCVACIDKIKAALAQPAQEPFGYLSIGGNPIFQKEKPIIGRWETLYTAPPQRPWVELTNNEWFERWRISQETDETEAVIDFADFLIIAQFVMAKLKEKNNG